MIFKKILITFILLNIFITNVFSDNISIVSNNILCTNIGKDIIMKGGNIIDSAISIMLCEGIVEPQDSGIGGGFYGIFKLKNKIFIVNSREITPEKIKYRNDIRRKYSNIGIPSSIKGYELLHKKFGKLSWRNIFNPVIKLCFKGFISSEHLTYAININKFFYIVNKRLLNNNYIIKNIPLCKTLKKISINGADYFYKNISKKIITDLNPWNKFINYKDFINYKAKIDKPSHSYYGNLKIYSSNYPGPGKILIKMFKKMLFLKKKTNLLNIIKKFYKKQFIEENKIYKQKTNITITNKNIYNSKHGTSNICLKHNEDVLCITSTINTYFGSQFYSKSTGIILNNQLNDIPYFYTKIPPNTIPSTSISTTIILKNNKVYMALGGTGGNRIPAGILNVLYYHFIEKFSLKKSILMNRFFNMIYPEYEICYKNNNMCKEFNKLLKKFLKNKNKFNINKNSYNTVTGIYKNIPIFDPRRGGKGITFKKLKKKY